MQLCTRFTENAHNGAQSKSVFDKRKIFFYFSEENNWNNNCYTWKERKLNSLFEYHNRHFQCNFCKRRDAKNEETLAQNVCKLCASMHVLCGSVYNRNTSNNLAEKSLISVRNVKYTWKQLCISVVIKECHQIMTFLL